ncbi:hypothetical protein ACQ4PT_010597 [Festuca glaucescens]
MDPPQGPPTAGGAPPSAAVVDVPVGGPPNAGDVSAMISATIPSKRKRIPKQFFEAPAAAAAPPAAAPPAAKKGGRMKTKAAGPRGAPQSKVKTKAVSRIGLAPPPSSKATAPPPSVPSDATPAPPPPTMEVDKVFDVESTTSYMDMLNESTVDLDAGIDASIFSQGTTAKEDGLPLLIIDSSVVAVELASKLKLLLDVSTEDDPKCEFRHQDANKRDVQGTVTTHELSFNGKKYGSSEGRIVIGGMLEVEAKVTWSTMGVPCFKW